MMDSDFESMKDLKPSLNDPQPAPSESVHPAVWDLVIKDMQERDRTGFCKYRTRLKPFNGRDALVDAYQEALDLVVYLRQEIYQREQNKRVCPKCIGRGVDVDADCVNCDFCNGKGLVYAS